MGVILVQYRNWRFLKTTVILENTARREKKEDRNGARDDSIHPPLKRGGTGGWRYGGPMGDMFNTALRRMLLMRGNSPFARQADTSECEHAKMQ